MSEKYWKVRKKRTTKIKLNDWRVIANHRASFIKSGRPWYLFKIRACLSVNSLKSSVSLSIVSRNLTCECGINSTPDNKNKSVQYFLDSWTTINQWTSSFHVMVVKHYFGRINRYENSHYKKQIQNIKQNPFSLQCTQFTILIKYVSTF